VHSSRQSVVGHGGACPSPQNYPTQWGNLDPHPTYASFRPPEPTTQTASQSVWLFFAQITTDCRRMCQDMSFPLKSVHLHGDLDPLPSNTCFLGHTRVHDPDDRSSRFAQLTLECRRVCLDMPFSLKIVPSHGDLDRHLIHGSLGPPDSHHPKRHLDRFSRRAHNCDRPTDRQTDRPCYTVCNNRPHLRRPT